MGKIKILYFIPGFNFGGIESLVIKICSLIDKEKYQIDILKHNNTPNNTENIKFLRDMGCKIYNLPKFGIRNLPKYIKETKKFTDEHDYDVLHSHSMTYSLFLFYFYKTKIKKRILHSHTSHTDGKLGKKLFFKIMKYLVKKYANYYFSCSQIATKWGFGKNINATIIKNGIETNTFQYNQIEREKIREELNLKDTLVIGHIGRLTEAKNIYFLLDIFYQILQINSNVKLIQIGDGPELEGAKEYAKNLNITNKVIFLGKRNDTYRYYSAFDVFLFPSLWEGFPLSVVEAQTAGLPCVLSSKITPEVKILDSVVFISLSNSAQIWAEQTLQICSKRDDEALKKVRNAQFDISSTVAFLESFYSR